MHWILSKKNLSEEIAKLEFQADDFVNSCKPGHHVIVKADEDSPMIPCVISGVNRQRGTLSVFIQKNEVSSIQIIGLSVGDVVFSLQGPYGEAISVENAGTVLCTAGANGILPLLPVVEAMKRAGNKVITVLGARTKEFFLLESEFRKSSDEAFFLTDDGSSGQTGLVTEEIQSVLRREKVDRLIAIGAANMISHTARLTRRFDIPLTAILYSPVVDESGLSGIFRVSLCSDSKFIRVDGPEFNAYYPDFETLMKRMKSRIFDDFLGNQDYRRILVF